MKRIFFLVCFLISLSAYSQTKKLNYGADIQYVDEKEAPGATILIGNVVMSHEGAILTSQKALFYKEQSFFKAFGNVVINQGDTITQTSDYTDYDANSKQALSWGNVVLKDPSMTLSTDTLQFDRLNQKLYYQTFGTIKDVKNTLKSKRGNYFLKTKKFTAQTRVTVENPDIFLESNYLDYYTESGLAYLNGPSTITNKKNQNKIYSEKGFYDTKTDISHFVKNAKLYIDQRTIEGDSLYYDKRKGFASATNNIIVKDTVENFITKGNYAELYELKDSLFIIKKAVAISIIEKDSMFIHGDRILVTGKPDKRIVRTFKNVKIFKSDLQGKCDSLHTNQATGLTRMFKNPVIWSDKSQMTGDSIHLVSNPKTEQLDSLKILGNAFIVQKDSLVENDFNQIKGRNMYGKFYDNKLKTLVVKGNAEAVNFNRNEANILESITKQLCSNIEFGLEENQIIYIKCITDTDGKTYPPSKLPLEERKLAGFIWRETERPKKRDDIFIKDGVDLSNEKEKETVVNKKSELDKPKPKPKKDLKRNK